MARNNNFLCLDTPPSAGGCLWLTCFLVDSSLCELFFSQPASPTRESATLSSTFLSIISSNVTKPIEYIPVIFHNLVHLVVEFQLEEFSFILDSFRL